MCIFSKSLQLSLSVFFTVLLLHLWPMKSWFFCVLGATGYTEPKKRNVCRAVRNVCLPRGLKLASPSVLAASCEGGHLQMWWQNIDLHPQPFSPATENVKFLRAAENLPVKLLSCLHIAEQIPWLAVLLHLVYFVVLNTLAAPLPLELAVLHTSAQRSCSLGVLLNLCKSLCAMQITRSHQIISHEANGASNGCTDYSSQQCWGFAVLSITC